MRVLSSKWSAYTRAFSLRVWIVGSTVMILVGVLSGAFGADPWKVVNLVFLLVFGFLLSRVTRTLVDSVSDGGDHLLVSRAGKLERIPLKHIVDVEVGYLVNTGRVVLHLAPASAFGEQIAFVPRYALSFTGIGANPIAKELLRRAQAARSESAA
jgi:hypothetical protein